MVILGVLLLAAAVALTIGIFVGNGTDVSAGVYGITVNNVSIGWLFIVGVITGVVALIGIALIVSGLRRKARRARERRAERRDKDQRERALREENARLNAKLQEGRPVTPTPVDDGAHAADTPGPDGNGTPVTPERVDGDGTGRHQVETAAAPQETRRS